MAIRVGGTIVVDDSRNITNAVNGTFSGDLTINGGDIILGGTGRIQGIDTVTDPTDAASKAYVDANAGASLTGTNANATRQIVFTDNSELFFDNSGAGLTYNPASETLFVSSISANSFSGGNFNGNIISGNSVSGTSITGTTASFTSYVRVGDGSSTSPSFGFNSDPDTGFYRVGSGTINVTTDNSAIFQFSPSGIFSSVSLDMGGQSISNLDDPAAPQDAATKAYVDANAGASIPVNDHSGDTTFRSLVFIDPADSTLSDLYQTSALQYSGGVNNRLLLGNDPATSTPGFITVFNGSTSSVIGSEVVSTPRLSVDGGTSTLPSIGFGGASDSDTGFFRNGSNSIGVSLGATSRWVFSSPTIFTDLSIDMGSQRITSLADPTNPQDAATKAYVDANAGGGITLTGDNANTAYKVPFTDESNLFFDNSGTSVAYNPSTGRLTAATMAPLFLYSGDGTNANPSISFANDTDTGFYNSSNAINVTTGGTAIFQFAGIGLTSLVPLSMNSQKITSVQDPTNPQDAATKAYVDANAGGGGVTISNDTSTNATRYITFSDQTSGSESTLNVSSTKLTFNPNTGTLSATNFNELSDSRTKNSIERIENASEKVNAISGYTFKKNSEGDRKFAGVIAQEIEKVLPEVVSENEDGFKTVSYGNIVALLIEAVKEQNIKIAELEARLGG